MLKSMTAYGRATNTTALGRLTVEIQSVNRKHLEINTFMPRELIRFDADIKKMISAAIGRGQVNVRIWATFEQECPQTAVPNIPLALQLKKAWQEMADALEMALDEEAFFEMLSRTEGIVHFEETIVDEAEWRSALQQVTEKALNHLQAMKEAEGEALFRDIAKRFHILGALMKGVAAKAPGACDRYRLKLQERINEVMGTAVDSEERILREVCLFAEKIDVEEEITRFQSHLQQAEALLQNPGQGIGKTMEFLVQELNREANTVGAKASDLAISHAVVGIKSELERIREQIQNIE